jgi:hypothetical protein
VLHPVVELLHLIKVSLPGTISLMGIFSRKTEDGKLMLVFDIGSSSVGGALFWMGKSGTPKIVLSIREPIAMEDSLNISKLMLMAMKSLDVVAEKIHKAGIGSPSNIFCVLSSPWYNSQTRIVKFEKNKPFVFTSRLADDLIQKEIAYFKEEYQMGHASIPHSLRLVELKNIKVTLNGYEAPKPLEKETKNLEMTLFISMSPEQILGRIESTIGKYFHFKTIKFSSFMMVFFSIVRDIHPHQEDFLLIDINGEVTDISMTKQSVLRESISFPLGVNFILRSAASILGSSHSEARSLLSLLNEGHASKPESKKFGPAIHKIKTQWLENFRDSLSNLSNDISIPANIYISVDKDLASFFSQLIKTEQFSQYTLIESKFEVTFLDTDVFHDMVVFKEGIVRDPNLIIDSIYINRFFQQ